MDFVAHIGAVLLYLLIAFLCLTGLLLSCISISGTWLVSLSAILTIFLPEDMFVGWICVALFHVSSALIEVLEFLAGSMGVVKRGGSKLAGFMALLGGILGAIIGSFIPIPLLGPLLGMFLVSFLLVYAVEYHRLKQHGEAANIATGAIIARASIILLKVTATLGMILYLLISTIAKVF
jgi:uncharacterized protein YqgC (DUF456 family)